MADVILIQIEDDRNEEDEVWEHRVPTDTPMSAIGAAVQTLYPNALMVHISVVEEKED